jgi:hypothetical protein
MRATLRLASERQDPRINAPIPLDVALVPVLSTLDDVVDDVAAREG